MSHSPAAVRPRVIFDCNTLIQSIASESGPAAACIRLFESGVIEVLLSKATVRELQRVLQYPEVLAISPAMTKNRIEAFIRRFRYRATMVSRVLHVIDYPRDPNDEPYLDLAAAARADYLVTRDNDLLVLMTVHSHFGKQFRKATHPLQILEPRTFLEMMGHPWNKPRH